MNASKKRALRTSQKKNYYSILTQCGTNLQALQLLPPNAVDNLAVVHHQPGNIYYDAGDLDRALPYYREAIRYEEMQGVTVQPALSLRAISAKQSPTLPTADRNAEIASSQKTLLAMTPERLLQGNLYGAAQTRFNVAVALAQAGRLEDALDYARAALRNFESFGDCAAEMIERTRGLVGVIERLQRTKAN